MSSLISVLKDPYFHINQDSLNESIIFLSQLLTILPDYKKIKVSISNLNNISDEIVEYLKNPKLRDLIIRNNEIKFFNVINENNLSIIFPPNDIHATAGLLKYELIKDNIIFTEDQYETDYIWNFLKNKIYEIYNKYYDLKKVNTIFVNNVIMAHVCSYNKKYIKWTMKQNKILNKEVFDEYFFVKMFNSNIFYKNSITNYKHMAKNLSVYQQLYIVKNIIFKMCKIYNHNQEMDICFNLIKKENFFKKIIKDLANKINLIKDSLNSTDIKFIIDQIYPYYINYDNIKYILITHFVSIVNIKEVTIIFSK